MKIFGLVRPNVGRQLTIQISPNYSRSHSKRYCPEKISTINDIQSIGLPRGGEGGAPQREKRLEIYLASGEDVEGRAAAIPPLAAATDAGRSKGAGVPGVQGRGARSTGGGGSYGASSGPGRRGRQTMADRSSSAGAGVRRGAAPAQ